MLQAQIESGIGSVIIDPAAEEISTLRPTVTPQQEERYLAQDQRRHLLELQRLEHGWLGKCFGSGSKAGTNIAGAVAGAAMLLYVATFFLAVSDVGTARSGLLGLISSALSFIFGASSKRD